MRILDLFRLGGRVAVVTGSGRGIALALAEAGADVVVTSRRTDDVLGTAEHVGRLGRRAVPLAGDLRTDGLPDRLAEAAVEQLGRLDVWVSNAGGTDEPGVRPLVQTSDQQLRDILELNSSRLRQARVRQRCGCRRAVPSCTSLRAPGCERLPTPGRTARRRQRC